MKKKRVLVERIYKCSLTALMYTCLWALSMYGWCSTAHNRVLTSLDLSDNDIDDADVATAD